MTTISDVPPGPVARMVRRLLLAMYRARGWRALGQVPEPRRFILIAAPHTSNWDFVNFLGLTADLGLRAHFMGKLSLFRWPLGGFMKQMAAYRSTAAAAAMSSSRWSPSSHAAPNSC